MAKAVAIDTAAGTHEQHAWQLLSLLFDDVENIPADVDPENRERYKKERLSEFWKTLVFGDAQKHAQQAATPEERAIAQLSCNNVAEACHALLEGLDLRLATMVAQIGGDVNIRQTMLTQIEEWRRLDMLAEMEDAHRALYELMSAIVHKETASSEMVVRTRQPLSTSPAGFRLTGDVLSVFASGTALWLTSRLNWLSPSLQMPLETVSKM